MAMPVVSPRHLCFQRSVTLLSLEKKNYTNSMWFSPRNGNTFKGVTSHVGDQIAMQIAMFANTNSS